MTEQNFGYEHLLANDETVLWRHIGTQTIPPNPKSDKTWRIIGGLFYLVTMAMTLKGLLDSEVYQRDLFVIFTIAVTILVIVVDKALARRPPREYRPAYQNAVVTNQRLIMYNHGLVDFFEAPAAKIAKLISDYDNGSPAICVELNGQVADSVTVFGNFNAGQAIRTIREQLRAT